MRSSERSYLWWQERLAEEFFSSEQEGKPVIFFVNKDEAEHLHSGSPDGVSDLGRTVSAVLSWQSDVFEPVVRRVERWKGTARNDPPPCLPLLAATVLAASEMRRSADARSHNYYKRLAEVLLPLYSSSRSGDHTDLLRNSYLKVADLWQVLDQWLISSSGMRGVSTIRTAQTQQRRRIGYAQSQVLVRSSDLEGLSDFFQKSSAGLSASADPAELLGELRAWSSAKYVFSARLREALRTGQDDDVLGPLLTALAGAAKHPPARVSSRRLALLLAAEEDLIEGLQLRWHAPVLESIPEDVLRYGSTEFTISAPVGACSYTLSGSIPNPGEVLSRGLEAHGVRVSARINPGRHVIAMCEDSVAGGWVETRELALFEPHLLLVDATGERNVRAVAEQAGLSWYTPEEISVEGWLAFPEVTIDDAGVLEQFATAIGLSRAASARPRLVGGFRIRTALSRRCYLIGGEPDVILPPLLDEEQALLDGSPLEGPAGEPIALRGRGLAAGEHQIETSGGGLRFFLEPAVEQRAHAEHPRGPVQHTADTVFLPYGRDSRFIRADGSFIPIHMGQEPAWWSERSTGLQPGGPFEAQVPEEAVWLVTIRPGLPNKVTQLRSTPPAIGRLSPPMKNFWRALVLDEQRNTPHYRLWKKYREAVLTRMPEQGVRDV